MTWDKQSMRDWLEKETKATAGELRVYDCVVDWGEGKKTLDFGSRKNPAFVIRIPTERVPI
jgi:hypothetical protein